VKQATTGRMSDGISIDGFFSLEGKVALITGGELLNGMSRAVLLTDIAQGQEASDYTQQPPSSFPVLRLSSSQPAKPVARKALTKP